jgi:hypothetical protein
MVDELQNLRDEMMEIIGKRCQDWTIEVPKPGFKNLRHHQNCILERRLVIYVKIPIEVESAKLHKTNLARKNQPPFVLQKTAVQGFSTAFLFYLCKDKILIKLY